MTIPNNEVKALAERLVNLEDQKKAIADDIADLKKEADGRGISKKVLARTVRIMRMDEAKRKRRWRSIASSIFSSPRSRLIPESR